MTASWAGIAAEYDASFATMCAGAVPTLLDLVGQPSTGGDAAGAALPLLDAGCGTGIVARAALERGWTVDGVDLEPTMVAFAGRAVPGARFTAAGLAAIPARDGAYGAVVAAFALNHADHPRACAAELRRVAAPGARIAASVWPWQPTELNMLWAQIMDETGTRPPDGFRLPAESDFARTEGGLSHLLEGAGWVGAEARRLSWEWAIDPDVLWRGVAAGIATIGQAHAGAEAEGRARIADSFDRLVRPLTGSDGLLRFPTEAVLASAVAG